MITVDWKETDSEAGWVVPDGSATREFLLDKKKLKKLPRNLRDSAMSKRFKELVFGKQFLQVWSYLCNGDHDKIFLLKFPNGAWDIPWELLIDELPPMAKPPTICLARTAGKSTPVAPCIFDERLRILILKGASDGLDLDEEVRLIQSEWENLDHI